jgi:hypothetical protein
MFFFEKKNQETFVRRAPRLPPARSLMNKSLFASFSSEKEALPFFPGRHARPAA